MPYKNRGDYDYVPIHKKVIKKLNTYRVDDKESYSNIIKRLIKEGEYEMSKV